MKMHLPLEEDNLSDEDRARLREEDELAGVPSRDALAVGVGAIVGGVAGATLGASVAGPVSTAPGAGLAAGIVAGGLLGQTSGEGVDPALEDTYWRERHPTEPYAIGEPYELYEPAYRAGYEAYARSHNRPFPEIEEDIRRRYEAPHPDLPWRKAQPAVRAAWDRLEERHILKEE